MHLLQIVSYLTIRFYLSYLPGASLAPNNDNIDAGRYFSIKTSVLYVIVGTHMGFPANIASTPSFATLSAENFMKLGRVVQK